MVRMSLGISVVIPTWNGLELLRENLPSVQAAVRRLVERGGGPAEILVVDDGSSDGTVSSLEREFPEVRLLAKPQNEGFAKTCNAGIRAARLPLVALLNNDVRIDRDYLWRQAEHFSDADVFAVTAKVREWGTPIFATGGRFGRFRRGFWSAYFNYDVDPGTGEAWVRDRRLLSFYAIGGFATYDRAKLLLLGGFNELMSPFHWEDTDLSYRGWKRGWVVRYEPRSLAEHRISATIDAHYRKRWVDTVSRRNRLLFHWINLHSPDFLIRHLAMLAVLLATRILILDLDFYRSFIQAARRLGPALQMRRREKSLSRRSDRELARLLADFYKSAPVEVYYNRRQTLEHHPDSQPPS